MTISNLPQRPEENINNSTQLHKESIVPNAEIAAQLLSAENSQSFVQLAVDIGKQEGYDVATEDMDAFEPEDWFWVQMTDELEWEDEEERSELVEIEEERIFYASKMRV